MPDKTSFISQIQRAEEEAAEMLRVIESENSQRLQQAINEADLTVQKAESEEREIANSLIAKAKEEAKASYSRLLTDADNARRDVIENGKSKISLGKKKIIEAFTSVFE